jgi:hypothetical protein
VARLAGTPARGSGPTTRLRPGKETSVTEFRADDQEAAARAGRHVRIRKYTSNPLRGRPLLTGFGPGYLCPVPYLALAKATPWGVYFTGLAQLVAAAGQVGGLGRVAGQFDRLVVGRS